jgi:peptidoglycan/LPS O-acetylase OafA/YrhL
MEPLPPPENKVFYPALDGIRAIAVLMVFEYHYLPAAASLNWGWAGVDLFFVLSGFLITGILYDTRNRAHRFRVFYARRTLRIFPIYYLVLFLPVMLYPFVHWRLHPGLWLWPVYLGNYARFIWPMNYRVNSSPFEVLTSLRFPWLRYNLDHLWSLSVEEQFYLVWPLLVFSIRKRSILRNLCLAAVVVVPLLRWAALHIFPLSLIQLRLLYQATPLRADSLLLGGYLALCLRGPRRDLLLSLARPALLLLIALAAVLEVASFARAGHPIDPAAAILYSPLVYTLIALLAGSLILLAITPGTLIYRVCMLRHLRALGQRSYGFYVYHLIFFSLWHKLAIIFMLGHKRFAVPGTATFALAGTLLISWASFRWIEAPILRLKDRFRA